MMKFKCDKVPIMDARKVMCSMTVGHFTGTVHVVRDMDRVTEIEGAATFDNNEACECIPLRELCVDLAANGTVVFALFYDPKWRTS